MSKHIELGRYLKTARETRGLSQAEVARELRYSTPQFVSNWERGISYPPDYTWSKLIHILGLNADFVIELILSEIEKGLRDAIERKAG